MAKWIFAVASIVVFELTLNAEITKLCRKKTSMLRGEELICHNASLLFFVNFNLILNKTHRLTCENCSLSDIDEDTFNISRNNLTFLYLISSQIQRIKEFAFGKFGLLKVLNLRDNSISELSPKAFTNLTKLVQLDLSRNRLTILINNMFEELPNLDLLILNGNNIFYIQPEAFKGLANLKHLYLSNNELERLEGYSFRHLPNLLLLYLENNNIIEIDSFAFSNLSRLNYLYLNNNSVSFLVQYNFKPLTSLVDLQLRSNNLSEIQTSSFNGLTNLKSLSLGKNQIQTIKRYGFVGLDNLQNLELMSNDFEQFDFSCIHDMKHLNMLWLQHNRISNFNMDYKQDAINSLRSLGINDNNFTTLNYKLLHHKMPNIRDIFIYNNTWKCELLVNMFNFFQEKNINLCASMDCAVNKTKRYIEEVCVTVEPESGDKEDFEVDTVSDVANFNGINVILVLLNIQILIFTST